MADATDNPVIVVAGLGRCGTSMLMQMLHAGGMPCAGTFPAFEAPETCVTAPIPPDWWAAQRGRAVKVLDPQRRGLPTTAPRFVIWLDRDPIEQMKSHLKFVAHCFPGLTIDASRAKRRALHAGLLRDRDAAHRSLGKVDLVLHFEDVLVEPLIIAVLIAGKIDRVLPGLRLDDRAMARAVIPRDPACLPGMLEMELMRRAEAHG